MAQRTASLEDLHMCGRVKVLRTQYRIQNNVNVSERCTIFRFSIPMRRADVYTCYLGASHTAAAPCQLKP